MQARNERWPLTDPRKPIGNEGPQITVAAFIVRAIIVLIIAALALMLVMRSVVSEQASAATQAVEGSTSVGRVAADDPSHMAVHCQGYEIVDTEGGARCARGLAPVPGTLGLRMAPPAAFTFVCDCSRERG